MKIRTFIWVNVVLASLMTCSAWGQGFGTISGVISDPTGAIIASANVKVTEVATGQFRAAVSGQDGFYAVNALKPTVYVIEADQAGFKKFTQSGIVLLANQSLTVNISLTLGSASESVSVDASATQVDISTGTLSQVVDTARMVEMPLNGRNAAALTTLVAGAVSSPSNFADQGNAKTFPAAVTVSVNGARMNQVGYYLDGVTNIDTMTNINQPFPFPDALQEFSVQTNNYGAEYGQAAGGVVSVVTKSGTNHFHGETFEFMRNAALNARNYFAKAPDPLKRNQFGSTFGGPVFKDRTFFFGGYQGTRIRSNQGGQSAFVPTAANLSGDFSAMLSATNPNNPLGKVVTIKDPLTGQPFPNNQIPVTRFDPATVAMQKLVPSATGNGVVFYGTPIVQNFDEYIARGDHSISQKDKLVGRYYYNRFYNVGSFGGNLLVYRQGSTISSHNAGIQEMHFFSPKLLNDFRVGFMRVVSIRQPPPNAPDVADFGVQIYQPPIKAIQSITVSGYFSTGANPTAKFPRTSYSLVDDLRWTHGRHSFSFGGEFERDQLNMVNYLGLPGSFSFSGDTTGSALADYMLGKLRSFSQANGQHVKNRLAIMNAYAQDSWHVANRLTLTYGVRYEPSQVLHDAYHQDEVFLPNAFAAGTHSTVYPNAPAGLMFPGDNGIPAYGTTGDYKNIAPRVGFAYNPFGNAKLSVRGGFGVFFDSRMDMWYNNRILGVAPFSAGVTLTTPAGPFSNPYQGVTNPFPATFPPVSSVQFVLPLQVFGWNPKTKWDTPRDYSANLTVERDLGHGLMGRIAYVGSRGNHLTTAIDENPATYTPGSTLSTDQRRAYPGFSDIYQDNQAGNSWYHSAQFSLLKPMSHGITISANYTWSRSTDDLPYASDATTMGATDWFTLPVTDPDFTRLDRGPSDFNHNQVFVTSYVWQLPAMTKMNVIPRTILGSWEASGIVSAQSGGPLTLFAGQDDSKTGIGLDHAQQISSQAYTKGTCGTASPCIHWLNAAAFTLPAAGQFGNVSKGQFIGPGFFNWDMGVFKNFPIKDKMSIQFRSEFFNTFNHTNFATDNTGSRAKSPVQTVASAGFGNILAANDPRIIQLGLKVMF